jgi:hypothetical protein
MPARWSPAPEPGGAADATGCAAQPNRIRLTRAATVPATAYCHAPADWLRRPQSLRPARRQAVSLTRQPIHDTGGTPQRRPLPDLLRIGHPRHAASQPRNSYNPPVAKRLPYTQFPPVDLLPYP